MGMGKKNMRHALSDVSYEICDPCTVPIIPGKSYGLHIRGWFWREENQLSLIGDAGTGRKFDEPISIRYQSRLYVYETIHAEKLFAYLLQYVIKI